MFKPFLLILTALILFSCSEDKPNPQVENPAFYDFERKGQSTVSFSGQTTRILMATELLQSMLDFNMTSSQLLEMYTNESPTGQDVGPFGNPELNASSKSIKSKVAASIDFFSANTAESAAIKSDFENWIIAQVEEVYPNQNQLATQGVAGQIADGTSVRYVNGKGLEYDQAVGKGLIGALMVDQMLNNYLSPAVLDEANNRTLNDAQITEEGKRYTTMEHKWDEAYGYLFGLSTDASDPLSTLGEDNFLNKYLARVDNDSDFTGIAQEIFDAFKLGRAAIVAGDYHLRNAQAEIIRKKISELVAIRAVYYLQQGKSGIPTTGNNYGPMFHDLSEGFGFVYSLRFLRKPDSDDPYFTRTEVDGFINQLISGNGFWEISGETLDFISEEIASKFEFTVEQAGS
ncbi:MAG: DUF4856 domain-containing protein [Saprospiraceae bacterium]|nr:DUF4856 domain-containing protein [Saprospiraceae bacterium]